MPGVLTSTVGRKYLMGITGLIWAGFVLIHMIGNMLLFVGPDAYNTYSHTLTSMELIYVAEAILVIALLVHIYCALSLTLSNRAAKNQKYAVKAKVKRSAFASSTMGIQGSIVLVFIILHLITFKYGTEYETTVHGVAMRDLARLVVEVFQNPTVVAWYVVALVLLGFHLSHGFSSSFQSLGLMNGTYREPLRKLSWAYAIIVAAGFISQPLYAYFFAH